jgi:hypothetical protein
LRKNLEGSNFHADSHADIEWMRQVLQKEVNDDALHRKFVDLPELRVLLKYLRNGRLRDRNRAMV